MSVFETIRQRRSIRTFLARPIEQEKITKILEAGRWAPSGLNNQPWRFVVVSNRAVKENLSQFTKYKSLLARSAALILVFLDKEKSYHEIKDAQAIGACIQNMLLCTTELKLGSCWLGEIINQKDKVRDFLGLAPRFEMMAAIALGYPKITGRSSRVSLKTLIMKTID